jgi:hypothetical protein
MVKFNLIEFNREQIKLLTEYIFLGSFHKRLKNLDSIDKTKIFLCY